MLGNMYEWCQEQYGPTTQTAEGTYEHINENPRLLRGGTFFDPPALVRSANRNGYAPANRSTNYGFRPSRTYH